MLPGYMFTITTCVPQLQCFPYQLKSMVFGGKLDIIYFSSAVHKACSLYLRVEIEIMKHWYNALPSTQWVSAVAWADRFWSPTNWTIRVWLLCSLNIMLDNVLLCQQMLPTSQPCSSQIATVRSKEHVASTCPNSGWAHVTLHTEPEWHCTSHTHQIDESSR